MVLYYLVFFLTFLKINIIKIYYKYSNKIFDRIVKNLLQSYYIINLYFKI